MDGKGYLRSSKIDYEKDHTGFIADGLVITTDGLCTLEDGGEPFGDPDFKTFLPNGKRLFQLQILEVFNS